MIKVAIIGANEFQNRLILKAKELGYETHVFAWECGDIGEKTADYFYPISITEKEKILEKCKEIKPDGITSIASDLAVITVNYVAEALGLTANSFNDSIICTNKYEMRKAFKKANINTPLFEKVQSMEEVTISKFPLIVKPTDRSGSRAIALVNDKNELKEAIDKAVFNSFEKYAIVEEVIYGNEYSCECISFNGKHNYLTITKKYTTGFPKCIETGHREPCDLTDEQIEIVKKEVFKGLNALNIKNGASHTEFKINENNEVKIIEIGSRMGGDCIGSDLVYISTGYDFLKMVLDVSLGKEPSLVKEHEERVAVIKFIFSKEDLDFLEDISKKYPENIYYKSEITDMNHTIMDSSSRYGFYILSFKNLNEYKNRFKGGLK